MKENWTALRRCPLFASLTEEGLTEALEKLNGIDQDYEKNQFIFRMGEAANTLGVVLKGSVHVIKEDYWGNRYILTKLEEGELFGETFLWAQTQALPVSVRAAEDCRVLLIGHENFMENQNFGDLQKILLGNMLKVLANKNLFLTQKMEHLTKRSIREKALSYLSAEAARQKTDRFQIPFNRQEMADYLSVDRSALSKELSEIQKEGLIWFHKNTFQMKK